MKSDNVSNDNNDITEEDEDE